MSKYFVTTLVEIIFKEQGYKIIPNEGIKVLWKSTFRALNSRSDFMGIPPRGPRNQVAKPCHNLC